MPGRFVHLLWQALGQQWGGVIQTDNPTYLIQQMYKERKSDPALSAVSIQRSPFKPDEEIWLVKEKPNAEEGGGENSPSQS